MTNDASSPPADENTGASKKLIGSAVVVAAIVVLIFIGPWLISTYVDYLREVLLSIPGLVG